MPRRALTTCSTPGCPELTEGGRCAEHARESERARGSATARGYGRRHRQRFRRGVLERDICCVLCRDEGKWVLATEADHWPLSRRELVERGLDPDDPAHGRGLCHDCHSSETAVNQPGGWNAEPSGSRLLSVTGGGRVTPSGERRNTASEGGGWCCESRRFDFGHFGQLQIRRVSGWQ